MPLEVYADCADLAEMEKWAPKVDGFTTNPSLMRAAGVTDYLGFCREALMLAEGKPISFEVVTRSDVEREARVLADLAENVWVKVPWTELSPSLDGLRINVTGIFSGRQLEGMFIPEDAILSVFAGRVADIGSDPGNAVRSCKRFERRILWASTREVYSVKYAQWAGADIITMTPALLEKRESWGRSSDDYAHETIETFYADAEASGYGIP